mgnify:FL=1
MNKILNISLVFILAFLCTLDNNALAGRKDKAGTSAAPQLLIPVGARDLALGGSSLATSYGVESIFWNPAGLSRTDFSSQAMFSHMNYIADIGVEYFAVGSSFGELGTLALSLKSLSIGDIDVTTEDSPDGTGATINPTFVIAGVTFARNLADNISVGITGNLISEQMGRVSSTGIAFNAGIQYHGFANVPGLSLGIAVKNIGPQMQYGGPGLLRTGQIDNVLRGPSLYRIDAASYELPSTIEMGLGYTSKFSDQNSITFSSVFQNNNFSADEYKFGAEYNFENTLWLRGGYDLSESNEDKSILAGDQTSYIYGPTFGFGVKQDLGGLNVSFDYAYRSTTFFDSNNIFSLRLGF